MVIADLISFVSYRHSQYNDRNGSLAAMECVVSSGRRPGLRALQREHGSIHRFHSARPDGQCERRRLVSGGEPALPRCPRTGVFLPENRARCTPAAVGGMLRSGYNLSKSPPWRRFRLTNRQLPVYDSPAACVVDCAFAFTPCPIASCGEADSCSEPDYVPGVRYCSACSAVQRN